jgi:hypothetical protein
VPAGLKFCTQCLSLMGEPALIQTANMRTYIHAFFISLLPYFTEFSSILFIYWFVYFLFHPFHFSLFSIPFYYCLLSLPLYFSTFCCPTWYLFVFCCFYSQLCFAAE